MSRERMPKKSTGSSAAKILVAALIAGVALVIAACGSSSSSSSSSSSTGSSSTSNKDFKVALLSIGSTTDKSWGEANYGGGTEAEKKYGVSVKLVTNQNTPQDYLQQGAAFARAGYDMVLLDDGAAAQPAAQLAAQFPKVKWVVDEAVTPAQQAKLPANLYTWDPYQSDGSFLAGALAGLVSKTGVVGSVVGAPFPLLTRQAEAFNLGARCVKPDAKVLETFDGDSTYSNAALAKTAAQSLMGQGADVLFAVLDGGSNGVFAAAASKPDTYAIAQYFDQSEKASSVILGSVLYNLQGINADLIHRGLTGQLQPRQHIVYTLKNLNVGTITYNPQLASVTSEEVRKKLEAVAEKIKAGTIKVPDNDTIGQPATAAKIDPKSLGC